KEAGRRGWKDSGPALRSLCHHHRKSVREATRAALDKLKLGPVADFEPEKAFTAELEKSLRDVLDMVPVPRGARLVLVEHKEAKKGPGILGTPPNFGPYWAWLLETKGDEHRIQSAGL